MIDIIGRDISGHVDAALSRLFRAEHFRAGSIVSIPIMYPSGAAVNVELTSQNDVFFVSDRGGAYHEAEMMGTERQFRSEAEGLAAEAGIGFDGREMFMARATAETLSRAITVVANCSKQAVDKTILSASERAFEESRDRLYHRLVKVYDNARVERDAHVIGQSRGWRVSVLVSSAGTRAVFETIRKHHASVGSVVMRFQDFRNIEHPPHRFAVKTEDLGDYRGLVASVSSKIVDAKAGDDQFIRLMAA
ncbi:hypothetical protein B7H23_11610 [Notoacmeibacter marinus]|uniref:DUF1828 domain-containing protein n=1 Tax=Notoacmeibacter marinus TaxID=1876515 RepID=A0A231UXV4_9HYPH|nr:hypothetical protein [Notoacmeibacter marinus]OXT00722.1 hypothetical protein B7H23_11610 [Notoacmeibacter marinus]